MQLAHNTVSIIIPSKKRRLNLHGRCFAKPWIEAFSSTMKQHTCSPVSEAVRGVHLIKIHGSYDSLVYAVSSYYVEFTWNVDGYDWEVRLYPSHEPNINGSIYYLALKLIYIGEADGINVTANLCCRLVHPSGVNKPSSAEKISAPASFLHPLDSSETFLFMKSTQVVDSGFIQGDGSLTMECAVQVFTDLKAIRPVPPSNLQQHLGELLESQAGADVTFDVAGESFAAHKSILAARSPVFKAEFFGGMMEEKSSGRVEIKEMDSMAFGAMLRFIYTDAVPELDKKLMEPATTTTLAQHLLVAADRYGLDRLKMICDKRLAYAVDVSSAATTLALAERHGCSKLKAKCIDFISGGSRENLDAVMKTEGFKDLMVNSPTLLAELLVAAHGRKD